MSRHKKNSGIKDLLAIFSLSSIFTFFKLLSGLFINKVIASYYGAGALALVGNLKNLLALIENFSSFASFENFTKEFAQSNSLSRQVLVKAVKFVSICSASSLILILIFKEFIVKNILVSPENSHIYFALPLLILLVPYVQISQARFNASQNRLGYFGLSFAAVLLQILIFIVLWLKYGLLGIIASFVLSPLLIGLVHAAIVYLSLIPFDIRELTKAKIGKNTIALSAISLISIVLFNAKQFVSRILLIQYSGSESAGQWEALNLLSNQLVFLSAFFIASYYLPRLSQGINTAKLIANTMSALLIMVLAFYVLLFFMSDQIIALLFSGEFTAISKYIPKQFAVDTMLITSLIPLKYLYVKNKYKSIVLAELGSFATLLALSLYTIRLDSIDGAQNAQMASAFVLLAILSFASIRIFSLNARK